VFALSLSLFLSLSLSLSLSLFLSLSLPHSLTLPPSYLPLSLYMAGTVGSGSGRAKASGY